MIFFSKRQRHTKTMSLSSPMQINIIFIFSKTLLLKNAQKRNKKSKKVQTAAIKNHIEFFEYLAQAESNI